jgi:hypothetical protein
VRTFVSVVVSVTLLAGGTYVAGDRLGAWDPIAVLGSAQRDRSDEAGWTTHRAAGFSIALPNTWVPKKLPRGAVAAAWRANPEFTKLVDQVEKSTAWKKGFQAFDTSQQARAMAAREHFATNVNIIKARVSLPAKEVWKRDLKGLASLPNRVGRTRHSRVVIAGGPALKVESHVRFRLPAGGRLVLSWTQWLVVDDGFEYVITYTTTKRAEKSYAATFAKSAASFVVLPPKTKPKSATTGKVKPFRELADDACITYVPDYLPVTTAGRARATAHGFAVLARKLRRIHAPRGSRADYRAMLASIDDIVAGLRREATFLAQDSTYEAYRASHDAIDASQRARTYARRLHLRWCATGIFDAGT